jgi:hypothetical protein
MEEIQPHVSEINNPEYAVVLEKASFSWDQETSNGLQPPKITGMYWSLYIVFICYVKGIASKYMYR